MRSIHQTPVIDGPTEVGVQVGRLSSGWSRSLFDRSNFIKYFIMQWTKLTHQTLMIDDPTEVWLTSHYNDCHSWEEEYMSHFTLSWHMSWSCSRFTAVVQVSREPRHPSTRADCRCRSNDLRAPRSTEIARTTPTRQSSVCCYRSCLS
ncbi:hypothetical protein J6590_101696 [Homalodisca vitripennis]|nr:hypothetical protein J6590_101696 [Homalodisca vitripennis]